MKEHLAEVDIGKSTPKNFWWCAAVSCCFLEFRLIGRVMSAETDTCAEGRPVEDTGCLEGINRTQKTVTEAELGLPIGFDVQCLWILSLL